MRNAVVIEAAKSDGKRVYYSSRKDDSKLGQNNRLVHVVCKQERDSFPLEDKEDLVKLVEYVVDLEKQVASQAYVPAG